MKLRLIGRANLVREWSKRLSLLGFTGKLYAAREVGCLRWYGELDDARAALPDLRQLELPHAETIRRAKRRRLACVQCGEAVPADNPPRCCMRCGGALARPTKAKRNKATKRKVTS